MTNHMDYIYGAFLCCLGIFWRPSHYFKKDLPPLEGHWSLCWGFSCEHHWQYNIFRQVPPSAVAGEGRCTGLLCSDTQTVSGGL